MATTMEADPTISAPNPLLLASELMRAGLEFCSIPLFAPGLLSAPRGDGHPVVVLPGFATTDAATTVLRGFLSSLGYEVHPWQLGRNMGPKTLGPARKLLTDRIAAIADEAGRAVSLVGWSLGGVMARQVAAAHGEDIRQIITIGSPFTGNPYATHLWRIYETAAGISFSDPVTQVDLAEGAAVPDAPSTAIFSKIDGITAWENCIDPLSDNTDCVQVIGSHMGLPHNPAVLMLIAERLAQAEGEWQHFDASRMPIPALYPAH